jgi:hypothetical protein
MRCSTGLVILNTPESSDTFQEKTLPTSPAASRSAMATENKGVGFLPVWIFLLTVANFKWINGILENNKQ